MKDQPCLTIVIDLGKRCGVCGRKGAGEGGRCLRCVASYLERKSKEIKRKQAAEAEQSDG